ncbi:MAG: hypothetical protein LC637_09530 [Xanthomonadaceae bacterium]|nr:hypothetical protein [Xanthomonadaceae bacterium]
MVNLSNYRDDPLYPKIVRAVASILEHEKVVVPVEVLVRMDLLDRDKLVDWRHGRVPYLERVIRGNLTRLSRLLRILGFHAHDLNLKPSWTDYRRWGKGQSQALRFTKTGEKKLEQAYATHFVWPGKGPFRPPAVKGQKDEFVILGGKPGLFTTRSTAAPPGPASAAFCSVAHPHRTGKYASGALGRKTPQPQNLEPPRDDRVVNKPG